MLYTSNVRDFAALHAQWMAAGSAHAGIIVRFRQRMPSGQQVGAVVRLSDSSGGDSLDNRFEYLEQWRPTARS